MRHFVITDCTWTYILNEDGAKKYVEDKDTELLKKWYSFLWMSPNPFGFKTCRWNNLYHILTTRRYVKKIIIVFRKTIREPDYEMKIYNIYKDIDKWIKF